MTDRYDIMSVEYTETDSGIPCLCFCSDLIVPITNKTIVNSFCNYLSNDMRFKVSNLRVQSLLLTSLTEDMIEVKAKVNGKYELMGIVNTNDLYKAMKRILETLQGPKDES